MLYKEFLSIFNKDFNLNYFFYAKFLKKKKEVKKILKEDVDDKFLEFLIKKNIWKDEEIKFFYDFYKKNLDICIVYNSYRNRIIDLEYLKKVEDMDNLKYIVLNEYKDYLKVDINKIDKVDLNNIFVFIIQHFRFYEEIDGNRYLKHINLNNSNIERDLNFLRILGIEEVKGDFDCSNNKKLKSLKGCPSWIGGSFYCYECGLEELGMEEGVRIEGKFNCCFNRRLKSLKDGPIYVGGDFICDNCGLEELGMREGVIIKEYFKCNNNENLKSLKGSPSFVGKYFDCKDCGLEELGMQEGVRIEWGFDCVGNKKLKNLKGSPSYVGGCFNCYYCGLEELGIDRFIEIKGPFDCSVNRNLKTLKGSPSYVGDKFYCTFCNLDKIDLDSGITIEKGLVCLEGNNVTKEQVERYIKENNIKLGGDVK